MSAIETESQVGKPEPEAAQAKGTRKPSKPTKKGQGHEKAPHAKKAAAKPKAERTRGRLAVHVAPALPVRACELGRTCEASPPAIARIARPRASTFIAFFVEGDW